MTARAAILAYLKDHPWSPPRVIAEGTGYSLGHVVRILQDMVFELDSKRRGRVRYYALPRKDR